MLTDDERKNTIERISCHLERFDDDTLREMDRLTDPTQRDVRPSQSAGFTRRHLLVSFAAGAGSVGAAALGLSRVGETARAADDDVSRLRDLEAWNGRMDAVALDEAVGEGLDAVGAKLADVDMSADRLAQGLRDVGPFAVAAVQLVEPELADRLRDQVLEAGQELVTQVSASLEAWTDSLERPVSERLALRAELRAQRAELAP